MSERAEIFKECGKVLFLTYTKKKNETQEWDEFGEKVKRARKCTLSIISKIIDEKATDNSMTRLALNVLSNIHPTTRYTFNQTVILEKIIRDLADLCATLRSIETGFERKSKEPIVEAKIFCDLMADIFKKKDQL